MAQIALITGVTGQDGSYLAEFLLKKGYEVHGMVRFRTRDLKDVPATVAQAQATYTQALMPLGDRAVGLLDEQLLFYTVERALA